MAQIDINEFRARNNEAQRINADIQKAQGARDENKRQFEMMCKKYKDTYGEELTADNIEEVLNRVGEEVVRQSQAQAQAIERAKQGIVIAAQAPVQAATAPAQVTQAPTQPATSPVQAPVQMPVSPAQPVEQTSTPASFGTPVSQPTAPNLGTSVAFGEVAKPMSASMLSSAALTQSNTQPDLSMPKEENQMPQNAPAMGIPGWTPPQGGVNFDALLGGKFGG